MLETINKMVWGDFLLFLLLGTGLMLSIRFKFFQIFKIRYIFKNTVLTLFNKKNSVNSSDKESISQFQTFATALAATMGTGNIVGVATALTIGGAGAIFWMWISAILGMALVYAENYLGTIYRKKSDGLCVGGPMAYLEKGAGKNFLQFCLRFSVFLLLLEWVI